MGRAGQSSVRQRTAGQGQEAVHLDIWRLEATVSHPAGTQVAPRRHPEPEGIWEALGSQIS